MKKFEERDFSKYEGRKVRYIPQGLPEQMGIVVGCEYDIGITDENDKTERLWCLSHPSTLRDKNVSWIDKKTYKHNFAVLIGAIERGVLDVGTISQKICIGASRITKVRVLYPGSAFESVGASACAFSR